VAAEASEPSRRKIRPESKYKPDTDANDNTQIRSGANVMVAIFLIFDNFRRRKFGVFLEISNVMIHFLPE
jgi:hypothetical protein